MTGRFDYFIVLAEMRTGSNFLEANLNAFATLTCLGEAFNPHFIGYPNKTDILGIDQPAREADPMTLLSAIKAQDGLAGFRFFHDHDARVLDTALSDPRCAKIVLIRNPLDSYVSWKIAQATGQWKLTNVTRRKEGRAQFDADEFIGHIEALQDFQLQVSKGLQTSGQTAFYLAYEDLRSLEVMNGLAAWLGVDERIESLDQSLKPQNPAPLRDKVVNPEEMERALARIDGFNLSRTPNFEPRRGPSAPTYVAAAEAPLLFLPVRCGPEAEVLAWMAMLDGATEDDLGQGMTQKELRRWKRRHPGHRSFTVLRHPAARAHRAFCDKILTTGPGSFLQIRDTLRRVHNLPIPKDGPDETYSRAAHRKAFLAFLGFLRANLAGQTALRVDGAWCSQSVTLQGFGEFAPPDHVWREDEWRDAAAEMAQAMGLGAAAETESAPERVPDGPYTLDEIYDEEIETEIRQIYQRDFMMFGFRPWQPDGGA